MNEKTKIEYLSQALDRMAESPDLVSVLDEILGILVDYERRITALETQIPEE